MVIVWCLAMWSLLGDLFLPNFLRNDSSEVVLCLPEATEEQRDFVIQSLYSKEFYSTQENASRFSSGVVNTSFILVYNDSSFYYYCLVTVFRSNECPSLVGATVYLLSNASTPYSNETSKEYNSSDAITNVTETLDLQSVISHELEGGEQFDTLLDVQEGHFFALTVLIVIAALFGFVARCFHLPPLIGMLLAGFLLRNVPYINIATNINNLWSSALRNIALVVILTRGGVSLDAKILRRLKLAVPLLAFTPCIIEGAVDGVVAIFYLRMPWAWGLTLG